MTNGISRCMRFAAGLLVALGAVGAHAAPAHCSYGYQDSSCLTPQSRAPQTPPTCSTDAGWTTLMPAKWIGSGFTLPQCNYQAPPTCPDGYTVATPAAWTGSGWVAPTCWPPLPPVPQTPDAICSAAVASKTFRLSSYGNYSGGIVDGSTLTPAGNWMQVISSTDWSVTWRFATYAIQDWNGKLSISNDSIRIPAPLGDTYYHLGYDGPAYYGIPYEPADAPYTGYVASCAISPSGALDGFTIEPAYPDPYSAN